MPLLIYRFPKFGIDRHESFRSFCLERPDFDLHRRNPKRHARYAGAQSDSVPHSLGAFEKGGSF